MDKKAKRGRPSVENGATERLPSVRVTSDQLTAYKQAAELEAMPVASWVKSQLDAASKRVQRKHSDNSKP